MSTSLAAFVCICIVVLAFLSDHRDRDQRGTHRALTPHPTPKNPQ